eukprot:7933742-Alexandrium_andersonii.AAC.1
MPSWRPRLRNRCFSWIWAVLQLLKGPARPQQRPPSDCFVQFVYRCDLCSLMVFVVGLFPVMWRRSFLGGWRYRVFGYCLLRSSSCSRSAS